MGPISLNKLGGTAHRGGADGTTVTADSGGSGGAPAMVVDQRKGGGGGGGGAPHTAREEEKKEEGKKGHGGARAALLYQGTEVGDGPAARSGGGTWRSRAALSAGSGPAAAGAGGRRLHMRPALNRGEAGADRWARCSPRRCSQIWFKPIQKFKLFQKH
jgi:hypothetical protein